MRPRNDYEAFELSSVKNRRLLREEELILEATEVLAEALEREGINRAELAMRLGRSKAFVSQILAGGRNLTLRTLADVADALQCRVRVLARKEQEPIPVMRSETVKYAVEGTGQWPGLLRPSFGGPKSKVAA